MIRYILECMAFQLLFLIVYDFFLKRETFFQWNRVYLIGTFVLSLLLPWIKIEALKTTVSPEYFVYPEYLWGMDMSEGVVVAPENPTSFDLSATEILFYGGMCIAALLFAYKLYQINRLKTWGEIRYFENFTRVMVRNSTVAFSFFRSIFLGDQVLEKDHESIIQHELVHIGQRHTWDLLFFELMRIVGWFNPLVYVYQNRVSELHEFIADAKVAKTHKSEQYQLLLSQVFQTQHISFINPFFKSSLIKKRILMLQKSKSKKVWRLKYLLLLPLVVGMLVYSSLEAQESDSVDYEQTLSDKALIQKLEAKIQKEIEVKGSAEVVFKAFIKRGRTYNDSLIPNKEDFFERALIMKKYNAEKYIRMNGKIRDIASTMSPPSTELYESFIEWKKAFQVIDNKLLASFENENFNIKLVDLQVVGSKGFKIQNVGNAKSLIWEELVTFNRNLDDLSKEESVYKGLLITDGVVTAQVTHIPILDIDKEAIVIQDQVDIPFTQVEKVPIFPGCEDADNKRACFQQHMQKHISENFRYPQEAQENGIQGRVNIMFVIQNDGNIGNVRMRSPDKILEAEAARIISLLPQMTPGEHKGKKVRVAYSIPITFKLEGKTEFGARRNEDGSVDVPFAIIEKVPVFPGCEDASDMRTCFNEKLQQHIAKNFRYPLEAQEKDIQGRVNILFVIQEDGNIGNIKMRGPDKLLEDEAVRIISLLPQMTPGEHRGEKVRVPFSIPINFRLQGPEENESKQSPGIELTTNMMSVEAYVKMVDGKEYIKGKVTDGSRGVPGVNVSVQGMDKTVVTDFDGVFEIKAKKGDVLTFQHIGLPVTMLAITHKQKYHITNK